MASTCPSCKQLITGKRLQAIFACPGCGAQLKSNGPTIFFWAVIILSWPASVALAFEPVWPGVLGVVVAICVVGFLCATYSSVQLVSSGDAT
jgi:hypothetical protein